PHCRSMPPTQLIVRVLLFGSFPPPFSLAALALGSLISLHDALPISSGTLRSPLLQVKVKLGARLIALAETVELPTERSPPLRAMVALPQAGTVLALLNQPLRPMGAPAAALNVLLPLSPPEKGASCRM